MPSSKYIFRPIAFILGTFILLFTSSIALSCPLCKQEELRYGKLTVEERCIDVGGYELYTQTMGNKGPNIIFESGLGDSSWSWDKVTPQVAKFAHTMAYDRMGLGRSQTKPRQSGSRTAQDAVKDLRVLLEKAHIKPPYILVGHSLGGLYMQLFAQVYPQEVSAVVLVDSATREQKDFILPPEDANYYLEAQGMKESTEQVKKTPPFPPISLRVLTSGQRGSEWLDLQKKLLPLSPRSQQTITNDSGHFIQREQPDLVIQTLKEIAQSSRSGLHAQRNSALDLAIAFTEARNKHDIEGALSVFSENIIWRTSWGERIEGKKKLRDMLEQQFKDNIHNKIIGKPTEITDNKIKLLRQATMDSWEKMGINYLIEDTEVTVENGKITSWKNHYTPDSLVKLEKAEKESSSKR